MGDKTQAVKIQEIYTALLGVPDTDNRGIAGDIRDINKRLAVLNEGQGKQNIAIEKNTTRIHIIYWSGGILFSSGSITALILKLVGAY